MGRIEMIQGASEGTPGEARLLLNATTASRVPDREGMAEAVNGLGDSDCV